MVERAGSRAALRGDTVGPPPGEWRRRVSLHAEDAALAWGRRAGNDANHLQLVSTLFRYWMDLGQPQTARSYLEEALATDASAHTPLDRARALGALGATLCHLGEQGEGRAYLAEGAALLQELGEGDALATTRGIQALWECRYGDTEEAVRLAEEGLALRRSGRQGAFGVGRALCFVAMSLMRIDDLAAAQARAEESASLLREAGAVWDLQLPLNTLGELARLRGDYVRARAAYEEILTLGRRDARTATCAINRLNLGLVCLHDGETTRARALLQSALAGQRASGEPRVLAFMAAAVGFVDVVEGQPARGARLMGQLERVFGELGARMDTADQPEWDRYTTRARAALGDEAYDMAFAVGRTLTSGQAMALALAVPRVP
jgi:tetratricopeptide (TPR) repeat protein